MSTTREIVHRYIQSWNETDPARRRRLIEETYAGDGGYTDPLVAVRGPDAIDGVIATVQQQFPGHVLRLAEPIDDHHDIARFSWHLVGPSDNEPTVVGFDVAVIENGMIRQIYCFLDKVPAAL